MDILDENSSVYRENKSLPYAVAVLVLGIISIVGCFFYAVPGIVCGIIAIVLHKKNKNICVSDPKAFESSFKMSKAGNICGIIGLCLSLLYVLIIAVLILFFSYFKSF